MSSGGPVIGIDISGTRLAWAVFDYENEIAECEMYRLTAARQADLIKEGADVNERNHVSLHAGVPLAWAWRRARVPARHV